MWFVLGRYTSPMFLFPFLSHKLGLYGEIVIRNGQMRANKFLVNERHVNSLCILDHKVTQVTASESPYRIVSLRECKVVEECYETFD